MGRGGAFIYDALVYDSMWVSLFIPSSISMVDGYAVSVEILQFCVKLSTYTCICDTKQPNNYDNLYRSGIFCPLKYQQQYK